MRNGFRRRSSAIAIAVTLIAPIGVAKGQAKPSSRAADGTPEVIPRAVSPSIFRSAPSGDARGWAKFQWVAGHLQIDAPRHKRGTQSIRDGDRSESFTVTAQHGMPSVHYVYDCPARQWTMSFDRATSLRIESLDRASGQRVIAFQRAGEFIEITQQAGNETTRQMAPTWIHLYHQERELVERHFAPLIDSVVPHQTIAELALQTERAMPRVLGQPTVDRDAVQGWVAQLKHPKRQVRRQAERDLLASGVRVICHLKTLDSSRWDAHQRAVVGSVMNRLSPPTQDHALSLAYRFLNDDTYWNAWLADSLRRTPIPSSVASHLQTIGITTPQGDHGSSSNAAEESDAPHQLASRETPLH